MSLTEAQYQSLIIAQVGDDAAGTLAGIVPTLWTQYAAYDDGMRFLLAKRGALEVMLARVRSSVSFEALDGASVDLSDLHKHLAAMYDQVSAQISEEERGVTPQSGERTTVAPVTPDQPPDANDGRYRGSPYLPPRRRWP